MDKNWRPENWKNPFPEPPCGLLPITSEVKFDNWMQAYPYRQCFEAGASAMFEALSKAGAGFMKECPECKHPGDYCPDCKGSGKVFQKIEVKDG